MLETTVILIRHAEKHEWLNGIQPMKDAPFTDNHKLSAKGYERANALVGYFTHRKEMVDLLDKRPLACIICQDVDLTEGWGKSERPRETIWPLLQFNREGSDLIPENIELRLLTKSQVGHIPSIICGVDTGDKMKYKGKTVLISWCHQQLQQILGGLSVISPPKWPKGRYDVTWVVDLYRKDVVVEQHPQLLLYGDLSL